MGDFPGNTVGVGKGVACCPLSVSFKVASLFHTEEILS